MRKRILVATLLLAIVVLAAGCDLLAGNESGSYEYYQPLQPVAVKEPEAPAPPPSPTQIEARYYVQRHTVYGDELMQEYQPVLALYADGSFTLVINLYEGMSFLTGEYYEYDHEFDFEVRGIGYTNASGDDTESFSMALSGDTLIVTGIDSPEWGDAIGVTESGSVFEPVGEAPAQLFIYGPN